MVTPNKVVLEDEILLIVPMRRVTKKNDPKPVVAGLLRRVITKNKELDSLNSSEFMERDYPSPHCGPPKGTHGGSRPRDECAGVDAGEAKDYGRGVATSHDEDYQKRQAKWQAMLDAETEDMLSKHLELRHPNLALAADLKEHLATMLSERLGVTHEWASQAVSSWAESANDEKLFALELQEIAAEVLGVDLSGWQQERLAFARQERERLAGLDEDFWHFGDKGDALEHTVLGTLEDTLWLYDQDRIDRNRETGARFVQSVYDETQDLLARNGIDEVTVFRGIKLPDDKTEALIKVAIESEGIVSANLIDTNALESWSTSPWAARQFAITKNSFVLAMTVPVSRVWSTPLSGPGCWREGEVIIIGQDNDQVNIRIQPFLNSERYK